MRSEIYWHPSLWKILITCFTASAARYWPCPQFIGLSNHGAVRLTLKGTMAATHWERHGVTIRGWPSGLICPGWWSALITLLRGRPSIIYVFKNLRSRMFIWMSFKGGLPETGRLRCSWFRSACIPEIAPFFGQFEINLISLCPPCYWFEAPRLWFWERGLGELFFVVLCFQYGRLPNAPLI